MVIIVNENKKDYLFGCVVAFIFMFFTLSIGYAVSFLWNIDIAAKDGVNTDLALFVGRMFLGMAFIGVFLYFGKVADIFMDAAKFKQK